MLNKFIGHLPVLFYLIAQNIFEQPLTVHTSKVQIRMSRGLASTGVVSVLILLVNTVTLYFKKILIISLLRFLDFVFSLGCCFGTRKAFSIEVRKDIRNTVYYGKTMYISCS